MMMPKAWLSDYTPVGASYAARSSRWVFPVGRPSIFPPRRLQRAPQRPVAIARRWHLAASGPMPPALACKFTVSELAVLRIVGDEVRQHGHCARCVDEIAARAGVCCRMVKAALREGARLGLLTVQERRREAAAICRMSSGSSRRSGRAGSPREGVRPARPPNR